MPNLRARLPRRPDATQGLQRVELMGNPRRANGHRRDKVRARVLREEDDCWLCGKPVDKTLPPFLHGSPEVDEIVPVSLGGDPLARANCRLAHRWHLQHSQRERNAQAARPICQHQAHMVRPRNACQRPGS